MFTTQINNDPTRARPIIQDDKLNDSGKGLDAYKALKYLATQSTAFVGQFFFNSSLQSNFSIYYDSEPPSDQDSSAMNYAGSLPVYPFVQENIYLTGTQEEQLAACVSKFGYFNQSFCQLYYKLNYVCIKVNGNGSSLAIDDEL